MDWARAVTEPHEPLDELRRTGETLHPRLRRRILELGAPAVPALIALLDDDEAAMEDAPGDGWPPIHAVGLLGDLRAVEAIPSMLRVLRETDVDAIIHDRIVVNLEKFGAAAFEPAIALANEPALRDAIGCVVSGLGVRDERAFALLCRIFDEFPDLGASLLGSYGDERALPMLLRAIQRFRPDPTSATGCMGLADLVDSYARLGGTLSDDLATYVEDVQTIWREDRAIFEGSAASPVKPGRNDPCSCGSGKKYKRCCLDVAPTV